ncbi:transposase [Streptomyces sp. Tue6028]|uniref:transposase n=1 Tax=Streptomyces sp. Tue6028 TaxID=2036037 RepID=UPI003D71D5C8
MTDAEWAVVRDALPVPAWLEGRGGQPEGYCHRQMLDAVFYVTDNGVKWRSVPGLPCVGPRLRLLPQVAQERPGQGTARPAARQGPRGRGPRSRADCGDHRLAVGQGSRLGAICFTRLRREQEDIRCEGRVKRRGQVGVLARSGRLRLR